MLNLDAIRESDIATALGMDDLDDACAYLQGIAGITDGGIAGQVFSETTFDWETADRVAREHVVRVWLRVERAYAEGNP